MLDAWPRVKVMLTPHVVIIISDTNAIIAATAAFNKEKGSRLILVGVFHQYSTLFT